MSPLIESTVFLETPKNTREPRVGGVRSSPGWGTRYYRETAHP
jgi:hypothetical protein